MGRAPEARHPDQPLSAYVEQAYALAKDNILIAPP